MSKDRRSWGGKRDPSEGEDRRETGNHGRRDPENDRRSAEQGGRRWNSKRRHGVDRRDPSNPTTSAFGGADSERRSINSVWSPRTRHTQRRDKHVTRRDPEGKRDRRGDRSPQQEDSST